MGYFLLFVGCLGFLAGGPAGAAGFIVTAMVLIGILGILGS